MGGHSNAKATGLYDRRTDDISLSEAAKIGI
jgi:integrase/recombinase XerD